MTDENPKRVLLIGWDSATWDLLHPLLDAGELPHLQGLIDRGAMGTLRTPGPMSAPIVANSIATGHFADKHGVLGPQEVLPNGSAATTSCQSRQVKAFWDILGQNQQSSLLINFPNTDPIELIDGVAVGPSFFDIDKPGEPQLNSVAPDELFESLSELSIELKEIDRETMAAFVPQYAELPPEDDRLIDIGLAIAQTLSVHAVTTLLMEQEEWNLTSVNYPLIDVLGRNFLQYHAPDNTSPDSWEAELFQDVMPAAARVCDMLVGRLIELAGDDAGVILYSPKGLLQPSLPTPQQPQSQGQTTAPSYRGEGIIVVQTPGVPGDMSLHQVQHTDICPTILELSGLAASRDMAGHPVSDTWTAPAERMKRIASWETEGPKRPASGPTAETMQRAQTMSFQATFADKVLRRIEENNLWHLARIKNAAGKPADAVSLMMRLYNANPLQVERGTRVAETLYLSGYIPEALELAGFLSQAFPETAMGKSMAGFIQMNRGNTAAALQLFEQAAIDNPPYPRLFYYMGHAYLSVERREEAVAAFERSLELDPDSFRCYLDLSEAFLRLGRFEEAGEAALSALSCDFSQAIAHVALGRALVQIGDTDRAREAYQTAASLDPNNDVATTHMEILDGQQSEIEARRAADPTQLFVPSMLSNLHQTIESREPFDDATDFINGWRNNYVQDLETSTAYLNEYLSANAKQNGKDVPSLDVVERETHSVLGRFQDNAWTIRPVEPSDQPALCQMFESPFVAPWDKEILVTHPIGDRAIHGGVTIHSRDVQRGLVTLEISVGASLDEHDSAEVDDDLVTWLLRAGIARAAAGGAQQISVSFPAAVAQRLNSTLERLGAEHRQTRQKYTLKATALRDRCLKLVDQLRRRGKVPQEAQVTTLDELPLDAAEQFLSQYFPGALGLRPENLTPHLSLLLILDNQVIAAGVGERKGDDRIKAERFAVDDRYRNTWATPMLLGHLAKASCDDGLEFIAFATDENTFPGWVKIARRLGSEVEQEIHKFSIDLSLPWTPPTATN